MKAKNFEVTAKSGSVMIQAADIDGALKVYRLDALDENVLCIRESNFQQSTLSKESVMEVLKRVQVKTSLEKYGLSNADYKTRLAYLEKEAEITCNLIPAVSDDKLLELLLSENGLDDDRIAKLFKDSRDAEYKAILKALHEAWEEIKQLKSIQPTKGEELAKMTEDGDCAVQAFQDTLAELNRLKDNEQLDVSEEMIKKGFAQYKLSPSSNLTASQWMAWKAAIKWLQSIQPPQMRKEAMMKKILKWLIGDFPWRQICIVIGLLLGCYLEWILAEWIRHFNY